MTMTKNIKPLKIYTGYFKDIDNPKKIVKKKCYMFIRNGYLLDSKGRRITNEFLGVQDDIQQ